MKTTLKDVDLIKEIMPSLYNTFWWYPVYFINFKRKLISSGYKWTNHDGEVLVYENK